YPPEAPTPAACQSLAMPSVRALENRRRKRELLDALSASWQRGQPLPVDDVVERWPGNRRDPDLASILFEDYRQRRQRDERVVLSDYQARFPQQRESLASILHNQALLRSMGGSCPSSFSLGMPSVGEELFGFRLGHP